MSHIKNSQSPFQPQRRIALIGLGIFLLCAAPIIGAFTASHSDTSHSTAVSPAVTQGTA